MTDGGHAATGSGTATTPSDQAASSPLPAVRGVAVTDLAAIGGAAVWVLAAFVGGLSTVERALALAPLVVVPLGIGLAAERGFDGRAETLLSAGTVGQPVGAVLVLGSLFTSGMLATLTAAAWIPVSGLLALAGFERARERGVHRAPRDLSETLVDAGLAYVPVAAVALVLYNQGITFWFDPIIVFLTAVHFHFAGFTLPIVAGVTGRHLGGFRGFARTVASLILVGPAIIAIGISFSPLVEVVAVGGFTLAVAAFGLLVLVRVVPTLDVVPGALVTVSALALPVSMVLALGYGIAAFSGTNPLGLDIGRMVSLHGSLNAYGFALCGVAGWRVARD